MLPEYICTYHVKSDGMLPTICRCLAMWSRFFIRRSFRFVYFTIFPSSIYLFFLKKKTNIKRVFLFYFLGCFNVTVKGHAKCVEFMKKYNLPLMLLGGGGYTIRNVARCWTYETAVALNVEIANELPYNDYFEYFGPDFKLHISPSNMTNQNTPEYMDKIK